MTSTSTTTGPRKTLGERLDDLTGHDEVAIAERFGYDIYDTWDDFIQALTDKKVARKANARLMRAFLFVERTRAGQTPELAFYSVMDMPLLEVNEALGLNVDDDTSDDTARDSDQASDQAGAGSAEGNGASDAA